MARKVAKKSAKTKTKAKTKKATTRKSTARKGATKKTAKKAKTTKTKKTTTKAAAKPAPVQKQRKASVPRNRHTLSYTQTEWFDNVMGFCGLEKRSQAKELCTDMNMLISECLKKGYKIPLMGLGKMYVRKSKARMGRNPATGEPIHIPAKKRIRFTASKALKENVL
ncbi:MAG: HU family DNA-binding protein [Deltaproteobacteria bacterium]|nr:HU family DNA-binding protein [Deltaproteobacteria bacterium]